MRACMHRLRQSYRLFLFLKRDETQQRSLVYDLIIYAISPVDDLTQGRNERAEVALPMHRTAPHRTAPHRTVCACACACACDYAKFNLC